MTDYQIVTVDKLKYATNKNISDIVHQTIRSGRVWEPQIVDLFRQYVRPGDAVLDIGANMGAHTMQLARLVGKGGQVLACEPQEHFSNQILYSAYLNGFGEEVAVYAYAVGDVVRDSVNIELIDPDNPGGNSGEVQIFRGEGSVAMMTVDYMNWPRVNFMKIDVETYEALVVKGALETIKRCKPIIVYEWFPHERSADIHTMLLNLGYSVSPVRHCPYDWIAIPVNT
jgi:FkbM family methyltransferase